ncbi:MAG: hypothetical protein IID45_04220 [Planctomycetes bacterium]|nr:hypothetical protein [Planctomycetota bacterium]
MSVGNFSSGAARLHTAARSLEKSWAETREHWKDETARSLEETHLAPIAEQVQETLAATAKLAEVVSKAARECEPREWD